jgi:hypothetical protein
MPPAYVKPIAKSFAGSPITRTRTTFSGSWLASSSRFRYSSTRSCSMPGSRNITRRLSWRFRKFVNKRSCLFCNTIGMTRVVVDHELDLAKKDLAGPINA